MNCLSRCHECAAPDIVERLLHLQEMETAADDAGLIAKDSQQAVVISQGIDFIARQTAILNSNLEISTDACDSCPELKKL